jgi:hypothetical protein
MLDMLTKPMTVHTVSPLPSLPTRLCHTTEYNPQVSAGWPTRGIAKTDLVKGEIGVRVPGWLDSCSMVCSRDVAARVDGHVS